MTIKNKKGDRVFNIKIILDASKNLDYKRQVIEKCTALFKFFHENKLITINPFNENESIDLDFEIYSNEFTEQGIELWKSSFAKWSNARDKDNNYKNMIIFEKKLKSLIKNNPI